jgi:hypothetical protein
MGNLNYNIDNIVNYIQGLDAVTAGIIQARALARLTTLSIARDSSTFAIQSHRRGRHEAQGNVDQVLKVIDSLVVADAQDLRRIEAVSQRLSELGDNESSSSSGSSSGSSSSSLSVSASSSSQSSQSRSESSSSITSSSSGSSSSSVTSSASSSSSSVSSQSVI